MFSEVEDLGRTWTVGLEEVLVRSWGESYFENTILTVMWRPGRQAGRQTGGTGDCC